MQIAFTLQTAAVLFNNGRKSALAIIRFCLTGMGILALSHGYAQISCPPTPSTITGTTSVCVGSGNVTLSSPVPTGGSSVTTANGYRIHTFLSGGTLTVPAGFTGPIQLLVVAGGGGGGGSASQDIAGGGGGAGGLLFYNGTTTLSATTTVTVGAGGAGATGFVAGSNGGTSSFGAISTVGGGYGGTWTIAPSTGGSGGGAGENGQTLVGAAGTSGQGYAGGNGLPYQNTNLNAGGGGGGAGGVGQAYVSTSVGGAGGVGVAVSIAGGTATYYAGGGGGGGSAASGSGSGGAGGNGGGGAGRGATTGNGTAGTANTGGGGGGALTVYQGATATGGAGGSGIVIVAYADVAGGTWSSSNTAVANINASTGVVTPGVVGTATITYTTVSFSGCTKSTSTTFTVNALPSITSATAAASTICGNVPTVVTANGVGGAGATVTWWSGPGATGTNYGTGNSISAVAGTYYANVTGTCTPSAQAQVSPNITVETTVPTFPASNNITLTGNPVNSCSGVITGYVAPSVADACSPTAVINVLPGFGTGTGPQLWVKADAGLITATDGSIARWKDISGNGNDFVSPATTNDPSYVSGVINGFPVIRFTTAPKYMVNATNFTSTNSTIFTVSKMAGTANSRLFSSQNVNWLLGYWGGYMNQMYANGWVIGNGGTASDALVHMYGVTQTSSLTTFYDYGNPLASNANGTAAAGYLELNGYGAASEFSNGDIAEVIYYNRVLTAAELQQVQNYLATKYNITFNPSTSAATVPLATIQAAQLLANGATINVLGTDASGNKATTTGTVTVTPYAGPVVATPASSCSGTGFTMNITGMAPAGQSAVCNTALGNQYFAANVPLGSNWTVETWFKYPLPANTNSWNTFLRGPNYHHIIVSQNSTGGGGAVGLLGVYNAGFYSSGFNTTQLSTGWHHMAAVGTGGYTTFYIDGVRVGVSQMQITENISAIGNYQGGGQPFGTFDETRIWNVALPQSTIVSYMAQAITASHPNYANLVSYYKWDNNGTDSKGSNTATATAGATYATTGMYTYTWSGPGSPTFSPASPTATESISVISPSGANSGNYSVYASANSCNSTTTTIPVVVTQQPLAFTVSGGPVTTCIGGTITVSLSGTENGTTYQLLLNGTAVSGVTITGNGSGMSFPPQTAAGTYTATGTVAGCVTNMTGSAVLTVNPLPQGNLTSNSPVCSGNNVLLTWSNTSTVANNYTVVYTNSFNSTTATATVASGTAFNANPLNPTANTTYTITSVTDNNGCVRTTGFTTGVVTVTVNALAGVTIAANPASPICGGSPTQLTATVVGAGTSLTWYTGANATGNNLGSSNPLTAGGGVTYYAHVVGTCNTVDVPIAIALETTAPTITTPAAISLYTSPANNCSAAGVFAAASASDNCSGESSVVMNVLPAASNLKLWVKADAGVIMDGYGKVAIWKDLSGNGNNFLQSTYAARPTKTTGDASFNGLPALTFNASQWMPTVASLDAAPTSTYTIFTVSRLTGSSNQRLISSASTNWLMGYHGGYENRFYANNWIVQPTTAPNTVSHLYEVTSNGVAAGGSSFYDYGTLLGSGTAASPNGPGILELNGYLSGTSEMSTGEVAEVIYYNTVLTTAQRQIVEGYLAQKYNFSVPYACAQAYQNYVAGTNTVTFLASDESGNTSTATTTATVTPYPGPTVTASSGTICSQATSFTTSGMAPAGQSAVCSGISDWLNVSGSPLAASGNAYAGPNPIPVGSNWTLEEWFNYPFTANAYGGWNTIFRGTLNHHIIIQRNSASSIMLGAFCNSGCAGTGGTAFISSGFNMTQLTSGWHHLAAVGTGGFTYFYIDGVYVGVSPIQCTDPLVAVGNYQNNNTGGTGGGQQCGQFDEVKIYNTALSQNAISNTMTQAASSATDPNWSNLLAYYKLDNNANDSKAGTYPGAMMNSGTATTATAFYTYNWSNTGGATFAPAASTTSESVTISGAASGNLSVYASANSCNSSTTTTPITVVPVPVVGNQTASICSNGTFTVTPTSSQPSTTYTWTAPAISPASSITGSSAQPAAQTSISQTLVNTTNAVATATYTVTPTAGSCPGSTFTVTVTVNPVPAINTVNATACSSANFTVTPANVTNGTVPVNTTYAWGVPTVTGGLTGGSANVGNVTSITGNLVNPTNVAQTATYSVTPTGPSTSGSCPGNPFTLTLTINPTPVIPAQTAATCSGTAFSVTPLNNAPTTIVPASTTYTWPTPVSTPTGIVTGGTAQATGVSTISQTLINTSNTAATLTYTVTPIGPNCTGSTFTVTVTIYPKPLVPAQTSTICSGGTFNVAPVNNNGTYIVPASTTYSWGTTTISPVSTVTGASALSGQTSISQQLTNTSNAVATVTYSVTATSGTTGSCVSNAFTVTVTVNPVPSVSSMTASACSGSAFSSTPTNAVNGIVPASTTYAWGAPVVTGGLTGGVAGSGTNTITGILSNPTNIVQTATYTITPTSSATLGSCAGSTFTTTVSVNPKPVIPAQTQTICGGSAFSVTPVDNEPTTIIPSGTTYTWGTPVYSPGGSITGGSAQATGQTSIGQTLTNTTNAVATATYTVTPISGTTGSCSGSAFTVTITINPTPIIPAQASTICTGGTFTITPVNSGATIVPASTTNTCNKSVGRNYRRKCTGYWSNFHQSNINQPNNYGCYSNLYSNT